MIAGDVFLARARPWLADNRHDLTRASIPLASLALAWWIVTVSLSGLAWVALTTYALIQLALVVVRHRDRLTESQIQTIDWAGIATDILFSLLLTSGIVSLGSAIYPIYCVIVLRVLANRRRLSLVGAAPLVILPVYLITLELVNRFPQAGTLNPATQWWLVIGSVSFGVIAIVANNRQQREQLLLRQALRTERQRREARVGELERTANELRARMRELHALEEGLRVVTSSLSLDEVLNQIVDSTVQTLGRERVHGMTLSLRVDGEMIHHSYAPDGRNDRAWAAPLARRTMLQQVPLMISDATQHNDFAMLIGHRLRSALCVPLFVGDGAPRGALTIVSSEPAAFSSSDTRHLAAFANQAGIAIANAEMHSRLHQQQRLLEAVVRDINDGMIVFDAANEIVLANPVGRQILGEAARETVTHQRLLELATSINTGEHATVMGELRIAAEEGSEEGERIYQAFASRVQQDGEEALAAIVLHDVTHHKAEERARTEFISMVSHELRNPLHSLNGFLKVVIQGRAGALTPLQQDFLQMADGQVELLKGRIAELLEFNRMKAGRLTLNPQLNDLSLLVAGTVNRLGLQAEQTGLELTNTVFDRLPECIFDSERIGQVLTNLIENAVKATPPGGRITISSQLSDSEVWISVADTGVGIAPGALSKIFQRYYRAHSHGSSYGNHLGLGLTICQQIIEGHGGRIWVESEEHVGSTFTFALPLRDRSLGEEL